MSRQSEITPEGLKKLEEEIEYLSTVRRREVSERIQEARDFGDISENAEYDDAKNEQAQLEAQIVQLEERLRRSTVVEDGRQGHGRGRLRLDRPHQGPGLRSIPASSRSSVRPRRTWPAASCRASPRSAPR